jgi:hypothetical protein
MHQRLFVLIASFLFIIQLKSQSGDYRKYMSEGNHLLLENLHMKALTQYQFAYKIDSTNPYLNFKIGVCYLKHPNQKHLAENYLGVAVKNISKKNYDEDPVSKTAPPIALFYYGNALHLDYKFDEAIKMYEEYKNAIDIKKYPDEGLVADRYIKISQTAKERKANPAAITTYNLGDSVNSRFNEISPLISADERMLLFTYAGPLSTGASMNILTDDDAFFEDIFVCYKNPDGTWSKPDTLPGNVNTFAHEATVWLSADAQMLILYRDDKGDGNLYQSFWNGNEWSSPVRMSPEINSTYWEPSACLSPDGNVLYFVSDRPGGIGDRDIYRCKKLPNGNWSKPFNLGDKINTPFAEESPFIPPSGNSLFFSSQGHSTMGGFDIFEIRLDSLGDLTGEIKALPYPINTTDDEEFYIISPDEKRAYYASAHEALDGFGEQDIYMLKLKSDSVPSEVNLFTLFKGRIKHEKGLPLPEGIVINVTDIKSGELQGIYRPQRNGNFAAILNPNNNYNFSYELGDRKFFTEDIEIKSDSDYSVIDREIIYKEPEKIVVEPKVVKQYTTISIKVVDLKNFKPEPGAKIKIEEELIAGQVASMEPIELIANDKGVKDSIILEAGKHYLVTASFREFVGESEQLSTVGQGKKKLSKSIYVSTSSETYNVDSLVNGKFIHYFEFNITDVEHYRNYPQFLDSIDSSIVRTGQITVIIKASASHIPTRFPGGLKALAKMRGETLESKLTEHLIDKGIDVSKIKYELTTVVEGPAYTKDYRKKIREYEKYQYVEAYIKPPNPK